METTQTNGFNGISVEDIRTDILIEMMHKMYQQLWEINDNMEIIQEELNRREQPRKIE